MSQTEKLTFLDEVESINKEAQRLVDEEDVFTNIVLSHSGYSVEQEIARRVGPKVSIVVGAHSHTLLYPGKIMLLLLINFLFILEFNYF